MPACASAPRRRCDDRGTTLVELVVAMGIFTMVLSVIVGITVAMVQDVRKSTNLYDAGADARAAFSRLDKQIRYATAINRPRPGTSGADRYVEFQSVDGGNVLTCHQWRLLDASGLLQQRSWVGTAVSAPGWSTVATHVVNGAGQPPFVFGPATPTVPRESLTVNLVIRRGTQSTGTVSLSTTFTARNTDTNTVTNPDLVAPIGDSDVTVCLGGAVSRP
jgi:type II secretory pathway pseudopilin PulG